MEAGRPQVSRLRRRCSLYFPSQFSGSQFLLRSLFEIVGIDKGLVESLRLTNSVLVKEQPSHLEVLFFFCHDLVFVYKSLHKAKELVKLQDLGVLVNSYLSKAVRVTYNILTNACLQKRNKDVVLVSYERHGEFLVCCQSVEHNVDERRENCGESLMMWMSAGRMSRHFSPAVSVYPKRRSSKQRLAITAASLWLHRVVVFESFCCTLSTPDTLMRT